MGGIDEAALDRLALVTELTRRIRVHGSPVAGSGGGAAEAPAAAEVEKTEKKKGKGKGSEGEQGVGWRAVACRWGGAVSRLGCLEEPYLDERR